MAILPYASSHKCCNIPDTYKNNNTFLKVFHKMYTAHTIYSRSA